MDLVFICCCVVSNILLYSNFSSLLLLPLLLFSCSSVCRFSIFSMLFVDLLCVSVVFFAFRWSSIKLLQYFYSTFYAQYGILCGYTHKRIDRKKNKIFKKEQAKNNAAHSKLQINFFFFKKKETTIYLKSRSENANKNFVREQRRKTLNTHFNIVHTSIRIHSIDT